MIIQAWQQFRWFVLAALAAVLAAALRGRARRPSESPEYQDGLRQGRAEAEIRVDRERKKSASRRDRLIGALDRAAGAADARRQARG